MMDGSIFLKVPSTGVKVVENVAKQPLTSLQSYLTKHHVVYDDYYVVCNGRLVENNAFLQDGATYHIVPRLPGGKGGFGSMLRAIGAQIEKTTNREACRDLSGRRMRDVNNEQKLRDWVAKAAERERQKEQRRKDRLERRKTQPRHIFDDPTYHEQKAQVTESMQDALEQGLRKAIPHTSAKSECEMKKTDPSVGMSEHRAGQKRKAGETGLSAKKTCEWLGIDVDSVNDLISDSDTADSTSSGSSPSEICPIPDVVGGSSMDDPTDPPMSTTAAADSSLIVAEADQEKTIPSTDEPTTQELDHNETKKNVDSVISVDSGTNSSVAGSSAEAKQDKIDSSETTKTHGLLAALPPPGVQSPDPSQDSGPLDLDEFDTVEAIEALGLDRLKTALQALGLKCGGTLQERATRLFSIKGLTKDEFDRSLFAKPGKTKKKR